MDVEPSARKSPLRIGVRLVRNLVLFVAIIVGVVIAGIAIGRGFSGGGSSDHSSAVASASNADYCSSSGYQIVSRLNNKKTTIYDCQFGARAKCVTYENGLANDETDVVRLLFSSTLGASKPSCLSG